MASNEGIVPAPNVTMPKEVQYIQGRRLRYDELLGTPGPGKNQGGLAARQIMKHAQLMTRYFEDLPADIPSIIAMAAGCCAHRYDFPQNLEAVLKSINAGRAGAMRTGTQVDGKWWGYINEIVVGIRAWLRQEDPAEIIESRGLTSQGVQKVINLLGTDRHSAKFPLLKRYMHKLVTSLRWRTTFNVISNDAVPPNELKVVSFYDLYDTLDGGYYYDLDATSHQIVDWEDEITQKVEEPMAFVDWLRQWSCAPCQYNFREIQEAFLANVGRLQWNMLYCHSRVPREAAIQAYWLSLEKWANSTLPEGAEDQINNYVCATVNKLLGEKTRLETYLVRNFLLGEGRGCFYTWAKDIDKTPEEVEKGY
jgi:hypothetical protein